jgi:CRP-like cAMP-binding protein
MGGESTPSRPVGQSAGEGYRLKASILKREFALGEQFTHLALTMTHELIANMLGVRREGVTDAAGQLQKLGVIHYARGRITVMDRPKLERLCCECYGPQASQG